MSRVPAKKSRQVIRTFERAGFRVDHVEGSHYYFVDPKRPELHIFSVAYHPREMKRSTLAKTIKHAGLSVAEFLRHDP